MSWDITADDSIGGGGGELPPEGNHPAVLVALVDLGYHEDTYQGQTYEARKALFAWELPTETKQDGTTFVVAQDFIFNEKASQKSKLRLMLQSWRGQPLANGEKLSLDKLIGKPCLINVVHQTTTKGKKVYKIATVAPLVKGMTAPKATRPFFAWEFGDGEVQFPDWLPYLYGRPVPEHVQEGKPRQAAIGTNGHAQPALAGSAASQENDIPF